MNLLVSKIKIYDTCTVCIYAYTDQKGVIEINNYLMIT